MGSPSIVSFTHKFSSNFEPKKYDFNICKRFFMEKMTQINQISKKKKKTKSTIFSDKFYLFSQEYRRIFFLKNYTLICKLLPNLAKLFSG